jgi:hypothetical protein
MYCIQCGYTCTLLRAQNVELDAALLNHVRDLRLNMPMYLPIVANVRTTQGIQTIAKSIEEVCI